MVLRLWSTEKMNTKRWAAHIGLLSAAAVLVTCIGVLISQGGDNWRGDNSKPSQTNKLTTDSPSDSRGQSVPISLSAPAGPAVAQH
jgi:hypothetical protein